MTRRHSIEEVCGWVSGRVANADRVKCSPSEMKIEGLSALGDSREGDMAFFFSKAYQSELLRARASAIVTGESFVAPLLASGLPIVNQAVLIACADPYLAMAVASAKFAVTGSTVSHLGERRGETFVHPSAVVSPRAELGTGVQIGAHCVVEDQVQVGDGSVLYPGCYLGPKVKVGKSCVLFPHVSVYEFCQLGNRVRLHAGVVIGADGFGYAPIRQNGLVVDHHKIYHLGRVVIGDDVEIGANSCVDRGTLGDTVVGSKVKIDNHVQIGHNCKVEEGAVICGKVGLAGSAEIGRFAYIGGQTGVTNKARVGDRAMVGAASGISKDVRPGDVVAGNPATNRRDYLKLNALLRRILKKEGRRAEPAHELPKEGREIS